MLKQVFYGYAEGKSFYRELLSEYARHAPRKLMPCSVHFDALKFARNISGEWTTIGVVSGFLSGFSFTGVRSHRFLQSLTSIEADCNAGPVF